MSSESNSKQRPEVKFEDLTVGMTLYTPDFNSESGIEEFKVEKIILYKTVYDPIFQDEVLEEVSDVSEMDYFSIGVGEEWTVNKYEKFLTRIECQKYMLEELNETIKSNEEMISRWVDTNNRFKRIRTNIISALS